MDLNSPNSFFPLDSDTRSRTDSLGSHNGIPLDVHDVASRPASPQPSPITTSTSVITDDGHSIASVDPSAGPEAKITFDIRAHSVAAKAAHAQAQAEQKNSHDALVKADKAFEATPVYRFNTRATLHKASLKAQIKFNLSKADTHFEQLHVDYLDALSKSSLSPKEQHEKYAQFKKALDDAAGYNYQASALETCLASSASKIQSNASSQLQGLKNQAYNAAQKVNACLNDIQKPHAELRNNIAANLHYRHVQLRNPAKTEDEKATLKSDISAISSFQAAGGLSSLTQPESTELNALFKDATTKYNAWKKEDAAYKSGATNTAGPLHKDEQAFKEADAAVMTTIRKLGGNLKGPPELRKNLVATLRHKEALQASATEDEAPKLAEEIATLEAFLGSRELAALNSKTAAPLTDLFREADQKYVTWQQLETTAKATEEAAQKATAEPSEPQPKDAEPVPTKKEVAQEKANQADWDARDAKEAFENADTAVMNKILTLLYPPPPLPSAPLSSVSTSSFSRRLGDPINTVNFDAERPSSSRPPPPPIPSFLPAVSAAGDLSAPPSKTDIDALKAFAGKMKETIEAKKKKIISDTGGTGDIEDLQNQAASLTNLLTLLDNPNASAEKINPLIVRMKEIEEKEKERATAKVETMPDLQTKIAALETEFIAAL